MSTAGARRAVFLDRDGVLDQLVTDPDSGMPESPLGERDVRLAPGAAAGVRALAAAGFALVCVSNQPAAAKGIVSVRRLQAVHQRVLELLAEQDARLDASSLCLHHPDGIVAELSGACDCRKPAPGMLLDAARKLNLDLGESWIVGDTDADMEAGRAAGCRTLLVECPDSAHKRNSLNRADLTAANLADGVTALLAQSSRTIRA